MRRIPDLQRLAKRLHTRKANLQDVYKIYQALVRLPVLINCLQEHDGPHAAVLLSVIIQPFRTASERLVKLRELIETTVDLAKAEQGDYVIKSDFDEKLGGIFDSIVSISFYYFKFCADVRSFRRIPSPDG